MSVTFTKKYFRGGLLLAALCAGSICHAQTIVTFAGSGTAGYNGDDEAATLTQLWSPSGIAMSGGNVYFADGLNNRIRKITNTGAFSTITGMDDPGYAGDGGPATDAQLSDPEGVAIDASGNMYVADKFNNRIRKITVKGMMSTFAGNGEQGYAGDGGPASAAQLNGPIAVTTDSAGNVYIVDAGNNCIRMVTVNGKIATIAGTGKAGYNSDTVLATAAQLNAPKNIAVDGAGNVYIADALNYRIRKVTPAGIISTISGNDTAGYTGDDDKAVAARLNMPTGVAVDRMGNLFIADQGNNAIRKIDTGGIISTVAGGGSASGLNAPFAIVADGPYLYVTEQQDNLIKRITPAPPKKKEAKKSNITVIPGKSQNPPPIQNPPMPVISQPTNNNGYQSFPSSPATRRRNG